jgi:hypothetical protein
MKLVDEIVVILSDKDGSLTDALLKTKVLMHQIGHKELADWVNDELNGYGDKKPVPPYRIINSRVVGVIQTMTMIYSDQPLPTSHLPDKLRKYLHEHEMRESISVLEEFATKTKGHLTMPLQPEYYGHIGEAFEKGAWVAKAWIQMEPTQIIHGLTEIRSRLLDFVLSLQDTLGSAEGDAVKEAAKTIDAPGMFQHAVFGDNATIVVGDQNVTTIKNIVRKGDFASLASALKGKGVTDSDVTALQAAIEQDQGAVDAEQKQFGPAVKGWLSEMLKKAIDTSWQIEVSVAAGLLTEGLKAFYF